MIKLTNVMIIQSIVFAIAGLGTLLVPQQLMSYYGVVLTPGGIGLARLYGATLVMAAIIYWLARDVKPSDARQALVVGGFVGNVLAILVGILNVLSGVYNTVAWVSVVIWLLMAIDFGYFLFIKPVKK
jgi:hypothetical protein